MRHDAWVGALSWWSCQSSVALSYSLLNHPYSFRREMFKLNAKFDADPLFYTLSYFECNGHTVHMLFQWRLLPPLTSRVKSSLFMHAHSSPLSLAARLHQCRVNWSCDINNGWTFSGQILYVHIYYIMKLYYILHNLYSLNFSVNIISCRSCCHSFWKYNLPWLCNSLLYWYTVFI